MSRPTCGCGRPARIIRYFYEERTRYKLCWYCPACKCLMNREGHAGIWLPEDKVAAFIGKYGKKVEDLLKIDSRLSWDDIRKINQFGY